jgi:hypothetical protein
MHMYGWMGNEKITGLIHPRDLFKENLVILEILSCYSRRFFKNQLQLDHTLTHHTHKPHVY